VLGHGSGGAVDQSNSSTATGIALNLNATSQKIEQLAGGGLDTSCCEPHASGIGIQAAGQQAGNVQSATVCCAASLQVHPSNTAIGSSGPTSQENTSSALGIAANLSGLEQSIGQRSGSAAAPAPAARTGQSHESPAADATPAVVPAPAGVRQSNASQAGALSANLNRTGQTITQQQGQTPGLGIQAAGQLAGNGQQADAAAVSKQTHPTNTVGHAGWDGRCEARCKPVPRPAPCARERCGDPCSKDRCRPAPPACSDDGYGKPSGDRCAPAPRRCDPVSLSASRERCPARHPERGVMPLE
jgi:hypothetical protein